MLMGEAHCSGLPLGYMFIHSDGSGETGAKERLLTQYFVEKWQIKAIVTLCDKDRSEINALQNAFPGAKLQLCYWHALRAVKERLKVLKWQPGKYDAYQEFSWIDLAFVPVKQLSDDEVSFPLIYHLSLISGLTCIQKRTINLAVPQGTIAHIRFRQQTGPTIKLKLKLSIPHHISDSPTSQTSNDEDEVEVEDEDEDNVDMSNPNSLLGQLESDLARERPAQQMMPVVATHTEKQDRTVSDDEDHGDDGDGEVADLDAFDGDELVDEEDAPDWNFADVLSFSARSFSCNTIIDFGMQLWQGADLFDLLLLAWHASPQHAD